MALALTEVTGNPSWAFKIGIMRSLENLLEPAMPTSLFKRDQASAGRLFKLEAVRSWASLTANAAKSALAMDFKSLLAACKRP